MSVAKLKDRKNKITPLLLIGIFVTCAIFVGIVLFFLARIDYALVQNPEYEVNTKNPVSTLFAEVEADAVENYDALIDTSTVGEKSQSVVIIDNFGNRKTLDISYRVIDTIAPVIEGDDVLNYNTSEDIDILSRYRASDNSVQDISFSIEGEHDLSVAGNYIIDIVATDESGNSATKKVTLNITDPPHPPKIALSSKRQYYIEVNRKQNVVVVYSLDQNGNYSNVAKVFVSSTGAPGSETPLGVFTVSDRHESLYLVGNVWGHYTLRIGGPYFFHSVPYFSKGNPTWDNLEYLEYNKLGSGASAGCVRLSAADAKWIYDNIESGTVVKIYDSDELPGGIIKPTAIKIDENSPNRGWDPTDPDPNNPWH